MSQFFLFFSSNYMYDKYPKESIFNPLPALWISEKLDIQKGEDLPLMLMKRSKNYYRYSVTPRIWILMEIYLIAFYG